MLRHNDATTDPIPQAHALAAPSHFPSGGLAEKALRQVALPVLQADFRVGRGLASSIVFTIQVVSPKHPSWPTSKRTAVS